MEWRTRSRQGRVAAGPSVPRRERRPPRHLRRASTSNAGAHARRPQTFTMRHDRRAASELGQQTMRTPTAGRPCIMTGTGRSGGTLSPGRPGLCPCQPEAECARGPRQEMSRPQEQGREALRDRARHQPRSASRGVAGCPRSTGGRRQALAPAQGKAFPFVLFSRNAPALGGLTYVHWRSLRSATLARFRSKGCCGLWLRSQSVRC